MAEPVMVLLFREQVIDSYVEDCSSPLIERTIEKIKSLNDLE